jgi:hypothetical protein
VPRRQLVVVGLCLVAVLDVMLVVSKAIPYSGLIGWAITALSAGIALVLTWREIPSRRSWPEEKSTR